MQAGWRANTPDDNIRHIILALANLGDFAVYGRLNFGYDVIKELFAVLIILRPLARLNHHGVLQAANHLTDLEVFQALNDGRSV